MYNGKYSYDGSIDELPLLPLTLVNLEIIVNTRAVIFKIDSIFYFQSCQVKNFCPYYCFHEKFVPKLFNIDFFHEIKISLD